MIHLDDPLDETLVEVRNADASSSVVVVCEHASAHIPDVFGRLGLRSEALSSHVAWDPGALALSETVAADLGAVLVAAKTSRLVYDCNRPPEAADAIPARSEVFDVPGNTGLNEAQKRARVAGYYEPFRAAVASVLASRSNPVLITIHTFTPIYHGVRRTVEIGVLNDTDTRLADALLSDDAAPPSYLIRRNEPYGPEDGVTHTLREHALPGGHLNVMLEVRNDLIARASDLDVMAGHLSNWLKRALGQAGAPTC